MEKYELREGEVFIEEYIDSDGIHVTMFKDRGGNTKYGFLIEVDVDTIRFLEKAALIAGMDIDEYTDLLISDQLTKLIDESERRKQIEEISD
jgi:hypothetical protein